VLRKAITSALERVSAYEPARGVRPVWPAQGRRRAIPGEGSGAMAPEAAAAAPDWLHSVSASLPSVMVIVSTTNCSAWMVPAMAAVRWRNWSSPLTDPSRRSRAGDAIGSDLEIGENAEHRLVYDQGLGLTGLPGKPN